MHRDGKDATPLPVQNGGSPQPVKHSSFYCCKKQDVVCLVSDRIKRREMLKIRTDILLTLKLCRPVGPCYIIVANAISTMLWCPLMWVLLVF